MWLDKDAAANVLIMPYQNIPYKYISISFSFLLSPALSFKWFVYLFHHLSNEKRKHQCFTIVWLFCHLLWPCAFSDSFFILPSILRFDWKWRSYILSSVAFNDLHCSTRAQKQRLWSLHFAYLLWSLLSAESKPEEMKRDGGEGLLCLLLWKIVCVHSSESRQTKLDQAAWKGVKAIASAC